MPRPIFVFLVGLAAIAAPAFQASAWPTPDSRHPSRRAHEAKEPDTRAAQVPEALLKFKGKTIQILFEVDFPGEGSGEMKTGFLAELLKAAGAKVVRVQTAEVKANAGEIIVMGEVEVSPVPDLSTPIDVERHERRVSLFKAYVERKKQLEADAKAAGAQVVNGDHVAEFFGLNSATEKAFSLFVAREFGARFEGNIPEIKFEAVGLNDVIDFLRDLRDLSIFVNWKALAAAGVDRQAPVTVNLHNISCAKALRQVLESAAGGKAKLDYEVESGIITISSAVDLFGNRVSRTYDIGFLLPDTLEPAAREKRAAELIKLVVSSIDPPSWNAHPAKLCSIVETRGELTVDQTETNQKSIENLLKRLHELMTLTHP